MDYFSQVSEAAGCIASRIREVPRIAVVLGSGLGDFADSLTASVSIRYVDLPHWPASGVVGHDGRLVVGLVGGRAVAVLSGRSHVYEGHDMRTVTFPVRALGVLGVKSLVLTNAAGGVNTGFAQGALMVIDDHINLMGSNPLVGPNEDRFGVRFPDMTEIYSSRLRGIADEASQATGVPVRHGVYVALHGPSYETPAEIRFLRTIGADAVGMSTAPEAIVARHMGMDVLGISCITNPAAGVLPTPLHHDEVMEVARRVGDQFIRLLEAIVARA